MRINTETGSPSEAKTFSASTSGSLEGCITLSDGTQVSQEIAINLPDLDCPHRQEEEVRMTQNMAFRLDQMGIGRGE